MENFEAGVRPRISVAFTNSGKTPAFEVRATAKAVIGTQPSPKLTESADGLMIFQPSIPSIPTGSLFTLPAGESIGYFVEGPEILTENTVGQIKKGQVFLFVFGIAWYKDGLAKPHQLTFCLFYSPNDDMFVACPEFNATK